MDSLVLKMPGVSGDEIDLTDGPWIAQEVNLGNPPSRDEWVSGVDTEGALPARVFRRDNREVTFVLRVAEQKADLDDAMDLIAALNQAIEEAKRVASRGAVDPAVDSVRLIWTPHDSGESRTMTLPVVGGDPVEVPITNQGDDQGWFLGRPKVRVRLVAGPFGYGDVADLASTDTDSNLIAANAIAALDLSAVGGDVPPWVDLTLTEDDSQIRHRVLVTAESPATGDTDYLAATSLTTTGYGGTVSTGTLSMTSTGWRYMAAIPAQSHGRPRMLMATHGTGGGQIRVRWKQAGVERVSETVTLPAGGYGDVSICRVEGDWEGVIEGNGTCSLRGLTLLGVDGWMEARSMPPTALAASGERTHSDDFSGSGSLGGSSLDLGGTWSTSGATTDWSVSGGLAQRSTTADSSARIGLAGSATPDWVSAIGLLEMTNASSWPYGVGLLVRYVDSSNFVFAGLADAGTISGIPWLRVYKVIGGVATQLTGPAHTGLAAQFGRMRIDLTISESGEWIATPYRVYGSTWIVAGGGAQSGQDPDLASGGTLASGRVGIYDRWNGSANTRQVSDFQVFSTPWRSDPLLPAAGDLRLVGDTLLHESGSERSYRGMGLAGLHPQHSSRLYVMARRGRDAGASVATNETDNLDLVVKARPRYLSVPS